MLQAFKTLAHENVCLDIIGDGPLMDVVKRQVASNKFLRERVNIHGYLENPYDLIADFDYFVLPSHSEGISRAAMEALFLGVKCILKEVDGNRELIDSEDKGFLFSEDADLSHVFQCAAGLPKVDTTRNILLGDRFRQAANAEKFHQLIERL